MRLPFFPTPPQTPILVHEPVTLRPPQPDDFARWAQLRRDSRNHLTAWEPVWDESDLSPSAWRRRLRYCAREFQTGHGAPFFIFRTKDDALLGGVTLSHIRLGASRSANVGYWIGAAFTRQGYATAALSAVLAHAFGSLTLNRVEAACQPHNAASIALLSRTGFRNEGLARDYLKINEAWRDHLLFAITARDYRQGS